MTLTIHSTTMLKFIYSTEGEIPEAFKSHYKENAEGQWVLLCEGAIPKKRHDEMRTKLEDSDKKVKEFETKFAGIDPDEYKILVEKKQDFEDGKMVKSGKVDEMIQQRVTALQTAHAAVLAAEKARAETAEKSLSKLLINDAVSKQALAKGLLPEAVDELGWRLEKHFKLVDGKPVAIDEKGDPAYGITGDPLGITEWVDGLAKRSPYLFKPSSGGGAAGGSSAQGGGAGGGKNPWAKGSENMTQQMMILSQDPQQAARLKAEAGVAG